MMDDFFVTALMHVTSALTILLRPPNNLKGIIQEGDAPKRTTQGGDTTQNVSAGIRGAAASAMNTNGGATNGPRPGTWDVLF